MAYLKQAQENFLGYSVSGNDLRRMSSDDKGYLFRDFIYQSNRIEGISDSWIQTISEGEEFSIPLTLSNHGTALKFILQNVSQGIKPSIKGIKNLHSGLMEHLLPAKDTGTFRKRDVSITKNHYNWCNEGEYLYSEIIRRCPKPQSLPYLMNCFVEETENLLSKQKLLFFLLLE